MYPFMPFSSKKLHRLLGFEELDEHNEWRFRMPDVGQKLEPPQALFKKLDESVAEEETARLGQVPA
jgi:methionyl-tRNA synthetase